MASDLSRTGAAERDTEQVMLHCCFLELQFISEFFNDKWQIQKI